MAENPKLSLTLSVLDSYFDRTTVLLAYLSDILELVEEPFGAVSSHVLRSEDSPAFEALMSTTYVSTTGTSPRKFKVYEPMMNMRDVIDRAQERLFSKNKVPTSNILTCGYRPSKPGDDGKRGMSRLGITNYFVNTIVTALKGPDWETLFQRIGIDAMLHLLLETSMFASLPNGCLCQMTGVPLMNVVPRNFGIMDRRLLPGDKSKLEEVAASKRKAEAPHDDERPLKRRRMEPTTVGSKPTPKLVEKVTPADIVVARNRLFYARLSHVPHKRLIVVGLPPKHVLNRLRPAYLRQPKISPHQYVDPDPRMQAEEARNLSKYVFPRQYGLANAFERSNSARGGWVVPDFEDRESEIKTKGKCKTPKRLKEVLPLLEKMIWRHGKCGYKPLRDKACPSKIPMAGAQPVDNSVILEMMSERSIQLRTQPGFLDASANSTGLSITPQGLSQAEKHAKKKPEFARFACGHSQVYSYALLVTKAVIPKAFWGNNSNFKHVMNHVKSFICSRRHETLTLHHIFQGLSTSACDWLTPPGEGFKSQTRVSVTDSLKRRELLEEFIFWYFSSFLLPLLKTTFYVTETSAFRNYVMYFRQDDWQTLCAPLVDRLTSETFEKVSEAEAEELLRQRKLGFSFVRLLPKETGVRPIVNLRRRKATKPGPYGQAPQSINQILQAAFQILTYEKESQPELLGASVFGPNQIYPKLKAFKTHLQPVLGGPLPKLYFVKVDVQACFDTIEQTKLLQILREIISEDAYTIQRYGQVRSTAGKIQRNYIKKAVPEDDHPHFLEYAAELANALRSTIFVDQVVYQYSRKSDILQLLEEHITENLVKIGSDYYRQNVGIPQGSVLSTILCSFFYGDLEKGFTAFSEHSGSALFRLIDDYMLITTSLPKARGFLDMMINGHPEYGCFISKEKTLTNFDYDAQIMNVTGPRDTHFPWCGLRINMKDLSVTTDYSRYSGDSLKNSLTVSRGRRPGVAFMHKMLQQTKLRSHILYNDFDLNTDEGVYLNIYQNFVLTAMKMHQYIRNWGISPSKSPKYIKDCMCQMVRYAYAAIKSKASHKVAKLSGGRCEIQQVHVIWLGYYAFHSILSRKAPSYDSLVKYLSFQLSLPQYKRSRQRFRRLTREALEPMLQISF